MGKYLLCDLNRGWEGEEDRAATITPATKLYFFTSLEYFIIGQPTDPTANRLTFSVGRVDFKIWKKIEPDATQI